MPENIITIGDRKAIQVTPKWDLEGTIFAFHGFGESADKIRKYSGLDDLGYYLNYQIIYPQMNHWHWLWWDKSASSDNPDSLFLKWMILKYCAEYNKPVYLTGFSDGAYFVHSFAVNNDCIISGIIPYAGSTWIYKDLSKLTCRYPVCILNNSNDKLVPPKKAYTLQELYSKAGHKTELHLGTGEQRFGHWWDKKLNSKIGEFVTK